MLFTLGRSTIYKRFTKMLAVYEITSLLSYPPY